MKNLAQLNIELLQSIETVLESISDQQYTESMEILSGSTIGQHIRHIIEFYQAITQATSSKKVNYDARARDLNIELSSNNAIDAINICIQKLSTINEDQAITMFGNYAQKDGEPTCIPSSVARELAYGMDHTIHHLAILKNGLLRQNIELSDNFGVAPSTIRYRNESCAQ